MIIVTGATGFIGSCIVKELNNRGINKIIIVDEKDISDKKANLKSLKYSQFIIKEKFFDWLESKEKDSNITMIIHMGACASTTETNKEYMMQNNYEYSKKIYDWCVKNKCRLIYASSAATYGDGNLGYDDSMINRLKPLNIYGESKKLFDQYYLETKEKPIQCVGLRFFNVYGPNEYHKGQMASVIFHSFNQIKKYGKVELFKSYKKDCADGEQKRDFIYIKDVISVIMFMKDNPNINGIFNIGTGKARTFKALAISVFKALKLEPNIEYIEMPEGLAEKYQYFTEAKIDKLKKAGYTQEFFSLEEGAKEYVQTYLNDGFLNY